MISQNLLRRHLNASQRSLCAAESIEWFKEKAKERQKEGGGNHGNQYTKMAVRESLPEPPDSDDEILELVTQKYDDEKSHELNRSHEQAVSLLD